MDRGTKKPQARRQDTQVLVRMTSEQKRVLDEAAAREAAALQERMPGASLGTGPWLLSLGLREARQLGVMANAGHQKSGSVGGHRR